MGESVAVQVFSPGGPPSSDGHDCSFFTPAMECEILWL